MKFSCDITPEAYTLLDQLCEQYDRPRGYVIERMIRKFHNDVATAPKVEVPHANPHPDIKPIIKAKYPTNIEECFNTLWVAKGRKGAKRKAFDKFKSMLREEDDATCDELTKMLVGNVDDKTASGEIGFAELHLTTYLNQSRWES